MRETVDLELLGRRLPSVSSIGGFMVVVTIVSMAYLPDKILYILPLIFGIGLIYADQRWIRSRDRLYHSFADLFVNMSTIFAVAIMSVMHWVTIVQTGGLSVVQWIPYFTTGIILTNFMWLVIGFVYAQSVEARRENERLVQEFEEQNRRVEIFAGALSHDLRNPLSVIHGYAELLRESDLDQDQEIDKILDACDRAERIVDDSLALARDEVDFEMESVEVSDVAEEAWNMTDISGFELDVVSSERITTDVSYFKQMLENLYRNAGEHAVNADTVFVGVEEGIVFVEDNGDDAPEWMMGEDISHLDEKLGLGFSIVVFLAQKQEWGMSICKSETGGLRVEFDTTGSE